MTNHHFTADAALESERQGFFSDGWVSVGLASAVEKGSALPVHVAGIPLLVTRSRDDSLHVLHNVCRHRGLRLVSEPCQGLREITCPYHAWRYGISGDFRGAPYYSGSPGTAVPEDLSGKLDLLGVRHAIWFDVIFVNLSGSATPFEEWIAPLAELWRCFDPGRFHLLSTTQYDIAANWKLVCENFLDGYHVPIVHGQAGGPETAVTFENLSLSRDIFGFVLPRGEADKPKPERLPRIELPDDIQHAQFFFCLFPNTLLAISAGWFQVISMQPMAADRSSEFLGLYLMGEIAEDGRKDAAEFSALMNRINEQDAAILPDLQAGRQSPAAEHGTRVAYWDKTIERFQARVRPDPDASEA